MKKKQIENQAQEGRSMVEMLGVLAVIGVISIGGIAGYRMAMNRYQANQIANEINLMRTDAKMKVARGVELLLGEPYDGEDGHLNFNANYGVKVESKDIVDGEITEKGYSFTLSNIPEGVCKPLVTLLDNMDDTADIKIGDKSYYDENASEDFCGETNEVMVAFSTKDIGGVSSNPEVTDPDQGDEPQKCDPSDPSTCEGECTESGCEPCSGDTPYWNGNVCVGCAGGTWDNDAKTCTCGSGQTWNMATGECACSSENQHWDDSNSRCVACGSNEVWNEVDGQCEVPESYCRTNADCNKDNKNGYFCLTKSGKSCSIEFDEDTHKKGTCELVSSYLKKKARIGGTTYYGSNNTMTWWSACRLCAARAGGDESGCASGTSGTTAEPNFMAGYEMLQCADKIDVDSQKTGYCHETEAGNTRRAADNISERVKDLREMYCGSGKREEVTSCGYYPWLRDSRSSCDAYYVIFSDGDVNNFYRHVERNALCE